MTVIAIDPGVTGAIGAYDGMRLRVWDIPTHEIKRGKSYKKRLDDAGMLRLARLISQVRPECVVIEDVWGHMKDSAAGAFAFGELVGAVRMAFVSCGCVIHKVAPQVWKAHFKLKGDKDDALALASRLLPAFADQWPRKKDHNRAECALIALYARQTMLRSGKG